MLIHASCVVLDGHGVLIAGPPGAGKSDLALRLIVEGGAQLVADDQTQLRVEGGALLASAPPTLAGLLEARELGLLRLPCLSEGRVALYVELAAGGEALERLPEPDRLFLLDRPVRRLRLHAFKASAPAKIYAALTWPLATDEP